MIDGFVIGPHQKTPARAGRPATKASSLHQAPQKTRTLMRQAVKKPLKTTIDSTKQLKSPIKTDPARELRAKTVGLHSKVNRFGLMPNAVKPQPLKMVAKVVARPRSDHAVAPARVPSMVTSASHQHLERLLDEALVQADAHKHILKSSGRTRRLKRTHKWLILGLVSLAIIVVAAILVWENLPSVAMRVADLRAHVAASVPAYTPPDYSFAGPVSYHGGAVTMIYKNKVNSGLKFSLTQQSSSWDSRSLEANYLPPNTSVQTSQVNGTTVYIYGSAGNAAWVNNGVFYSLKNRAHLTSDQVLKIVQSL